MRDLIPTQMRLVAGVKGVYRYLRDEIGVYEDQFGSRQDYCSTIRFAPATD